MRLTHFTNFALRSLMFAAMHDDRLVRVAEIAQAFNISKAHITKCVHRLGQWGYLENVRGRHGGFRLAKPANRISVGEIVRLTEDTLELVECFNDQTNTCPLIAHCRLSRAFQRALRAFLDELDALSIADMTANKSELVEALLHSPKKSNNEYQFS